jgi:hypothetical protein
MDQVSSLLARKSPAGNGKLAFSILTKSKPQYFSMQLNPLWQNSHNTSSEIDIKS